MTSSLWSLLQAHAKGRNILLLLLLALLFNGLLGAMAGGPGGERPVDLRMLYDPATVHALAAAAVQRGELGRQIGLYLLLDTPYPLVYASLLMLAMTWALLRHRPAAPRLPLVLWLPVGAVVADYVENLGMVATLLAYPQPLPALALLMSAASTLKWLLVAGALLTLAALLIRAWRGARS